MHNDLDLLETYCHCFVPPRVFFDSVHSISFTEPNVIRKKLILCHLTTVWQLVFHHSYMAGLS